MRRWKLHLWMGIWLALAGCQSTDQGDHDHGGDSGGHEPAAETGDHGHEHADEPEAHTHGDEGEAHTHSDEAETGDHAGEDDDHGHPHPEEGESLAVTAWGEQFEIFAEADLLVAGQVSKSHTHVTVLEDFSPLRDGVVSAVLRAPGGREEVFTQPQILRDGIFDVAIAPRAAGEYELLFRVEGAGRSEEIPAGRVRVGDAGHPGGLIGPGTANAGAEEVSFLKETQWKTPFATRWVEQGQILESARGTGRIRPAAGGELHLAAPVDGIVASDPWPYLGLQRAAGEPVMALSARVSQGRTMSELQALSTEKNAELELARDRLTRLEDLLEVGAVSAAEVSAARARVATLEAQAEAAGRQMASVRGGESGTGSPVLEVTAPFSGEVAEVLVSPGQAVTAGDPLVRMVRVEPVWIEVHLAPEDAQRLRAGVAGLWIRATGDRERTRFGEDQVSLVSVAPEVSERTGRVAALLQIEPGSSRVRLGAAVEAEVLLAEAHEGLVVPASAIVDDAGVPTVFVQLDGEAFERREVRILGREGDQYLVDGLVAGERVVTVGGPAIRRASLISSGGAAHGHVH